LLAIISENSKRGKFILQKELKLAAMEGKSKLSGIGGLVSEQGSPPSETCAEGIHQDQVSSSDPAASNRFI
jgi:hypothetical protein